MSTPQCLMLDTFYELIKEFVCDDTYIDEKELFSESVLCVSVFRGLAQTNKKILLNTVLIPGSQKFISMSDFNDVAYKIDNTPDIPSLLQELLDLKIVRKTAESASFVEKNLFFDLIFLKNLKASICGFDLSLDDSPSLSRYFFSQLQVTGEIKSSEFLSDYFLSRWQRILSVIASSSETPANEIVSVNVLRNLLLSGILCMSDDPNSKYSVKITSSGFKFLLAKTKTQCVTFIYYLILWLKISHQIPVFTSTVYLALISQHPPFTPIPLSTLMDSRLNLMIEVLREVGLIYMKKSKSSVFYCVPMINILTSNSGDYASSSVDPAKIIVESNFRIYCYDLKPLQLSIVGLFSEISFVFPLLVIGRITRESIHQALSFGISSTQIIDFLTHYMKTFKSWINSNMQQGMIPFNVMDQIKLWEKERTRIQWKGAVLYSGFERAKDLEDVANFADSCSYLLIHNKIKKFIIISEEGHEDVKSFWKRHRKLQY